MTRGKIFQGFREEEDSAVVDMMNASREVTGYREWEQLREMLERECGGELTHVNAVDGIRRGVGRELILGLQKIAKTEEGFERFGLMSIMPNEVYDAIRWYEDS
ncbi:MAG: hypothetical protein KJ718_04670 [Nanoarchaeota archaeon]|nr:hypothetical protein [Nanoarchaeota archaeon]MBU1988850.1 hypothetical protein [Nanoarchaeota archaeon]